MSEYISTIVDCDHSTGEKENARAPPTPPPNESQSAPASDASSFTMKSCALLQMSIAVQPAANAPNTALQQLTAQAGVGWPM